MSQHNLVTEGDQSRTMYVLDAQAALQALGSMQSGPLGSLPATFANMLVADTTSGHILKRNNADDAWDYLGPVDQSIIASNIGTDAYAIALAPAINAYKNGVIYRYKADVANTGAATLNFNGVGAKTIKKYVGGASLVDLSDNDILPNMICHVLCDSTADAFILLNPNKQGGLAKVAEVSLSAENTKTISSALVAGKRYKLVLDFKQITTAGYLYVSINNDSGANYYWATMVGDYTGFTYGGATGGGFIDLFHYLNPTAHLAAINSYMSFELLFYCPSGSHMTTCHWRGTYNPGNVSVISGGAQYGGAADLNRLDISTSAGTLTGTAALYEMV